MRPGGDVGASYRDQMYDLRGTVMDVKPTVGEAQDRINFDKTVERCNRVCTSVDGDRLVSFYAGNIERRQCEGRHGWVVESIYGFVDPDYRSRVPWFPILCSSLVPAWLRHARDPVYFYGAAYPASYIKIRAQTKDCITPQGGGAPWERSLLLDAVQSYEGDAWDTRTRLVRMTTVPKEVNVVPKQAANRRFYDDYVALNSNWSEGYSVPVMFRLGSTSLLLGGLYGAGSRLLGRSGKERAPARA